MSTEIIPAERHMPQVIVDAAEWRIITPPRVTPTHRTAESSTPNTTTARPQKASAIPQPRLTAALTVVTMLAFVGFVGLVVLYFAELSETARAMVVAALAGAAVGSPAGITIGAVIWLRR